MQILTANEVASMLKVSVAHVRELYQERTRSGDVRDNPMPCIRLGKSVRFEKSAIEAWITNSATKKSE